MAYSGWKPPPPQQGVIGPNVNNAKVEKLCFSLMIL